VGDEALMPRRPEIPAEAILHVQGKRGSEEFFQLTAYVRRATLAATKEHIRGQPYDMSDLLEHLLTRWLEEQRLARPRNPEPGRPAG
jgi:hypothetical protein